MLYYLIYSFGLFDYNNSGFTEILNKTKKKIQNNNNKDAAKEINIVVQNHTFENYNPLCIHIRWVSNQSLSNYKLDSCQERAIAIKSPHTFF